MDKLKYIIICMAFLLVPLVSADIETDRSKYYYNGSIFIVDGVASDDEALDSTTASNTDTLLSHGWTPNAGTPTYTNAQAYYGSVSMQVSSGNEVALDISNSTFTGQILMAVYVPGNDFNLDFYEEGGAVDRMWVGARLGGTEWRWNLNAGGGGSTCDDGSPPMNANAWNNLSLDFSYATGVNLSWNGVTCHLYETVDNGFSHFLFTASNLYIDGFALTNGGGGYPEGSAPEPPVNIDNINISAQPEPSNLPYWDTSAHTLNASANASQLYANFNASLYVNGVLNTSTQYASGDDVDISFNIDWGDGNYSFYINASSYNDSESTSTYWFVIDTSAPTMSTDFINESSIFNKNITGSFNVTDKLDLHSFNLSIDGVPVFNNTNIQDFTYNYTLDYDISYLTPGWHNLTVYRADGHTAKKLKSPEDYNPSNGLLNDYIKYTFSPPYKPGHVKIAGLPGSMFDTFTTEYATDRYKIKYKPKELKTSYSFRITTSDKLYIYHNDLYGGDWAVFGEHWLDFYLEDQPGLNVEITKLNDYEAEVLVSGLTLTEELVFNSVGDLNTVTEYYTFFKGNGTSTYTAEVISGDDQTIYLNLTTGDNISTSANLYYNGTLRTASKDSYTGYDLYTATFTTPTPSGINYTYSFSWNYSITNPTDTEQGHVNDSNLAYVKQLDNCTLYNTHAMNISFVSLDTFNRIPVDIIFQASGDASYFYQTVNKTSNMSLCIYPSFATLEETLAIQYDTDDATYYYNADHNLTSIIQLLTLYTQTAGGVTTFTVLDKETSATIEGAFMTMYRKVNGSWAVIESKYSDITGRVQYSFDASAEYQFLITKNQYEPYNFTLNPIIFDSYDVLLTPTFANNQTWDYDRVGLLYSPSSYYNNQVNTFTFFIHSPYAELNNYTYTLTYPGGTSSNSGTSPVGEQLTSSVNIVGAEFWDQVTLTYTYHTDISGLRTFSRNFEIMDNSTGNNTMVANRNKTYGMGLFERLFISVFFVLLAVGIGTLVGQPVAGFGLGIILYGYFVYIGFLPIWTVLITIAIGLLILGSRPEG